MRIKLLAVIVSLGLLAGLAVLPAASARSVRGGNCPDGTAAANYCTCSGGATEVSTYCECPSGNSGAAGYCECPKGTTQVGDYCETPGGTTVEPEGPATVFQWVLWGAGHRRYHGPSLKFHLRRGINGAPGLKSFKFFLPAGLTFKTVRTPHLASRSSQLVTVTKRAFFVSTPNTLTVTVDYAPWSLLCYLKNHLLHESSTLRQEIISGKVKHLTFHVDVTDTAGKTTHLSFVDTPEG